MPYVIAVACTTAFFAFEYFPSKTKSYIEAKQKHSEAKNKRKKTESEIIKLAKGTELHTQYLKEKKIADITWEKLKEVKKHDQIFGFRNYQSFFAELGWVIGLFIYSLFNLFRVFTSSNNDVGYSILHSVIISISIFYLYWIFQPLPDLSTTSYYFASVISGLFVTLSIYLMSKYKFSDIGKLQNIIRGLFDFIIIETEEEDFIREEKLKTYKKRRIELIKNALDNE
ncbi:hypothetical protein [Tenacibaculum sp. 190524A02b]